VASISSFQPGPRVFTIGHSNHDATWFVSLLKTHAIDVLVDTRSQPISRHVPHFDMPDLQKLVTSAGVRFVYLGRELGGRPADAKLYDSDGYVLYSRVADTTEFKQAVNRVKRGLQRHRIALMCSEEDPLTCHRRLLIGRVLQEHGVGVTHIRGNGSIESEDEVLARENELRQMPLFDPKEQEWKSIRSVSRRNRRPHSSGR
jgi:uncharacterized protein (DUF488 family)